MYRDCPVLRYFFVSIRFFVILLKNKNYYGQIQNALHRKT